MWRFLIQIIIGTHTHALTHTMTFEALKMRLILAKLIKYIFKGHTDM